MMSESRPLSLPLGLLGALVGGAVGFFACAWFLRYGLYPEVLPQALVGIGAGLCARGRSVPLAVVCCVAGTLFGIFTEWHYLPFVADRSLGYFVTHLSPVKLIILAVGAALSYRFALGFSTKKTGS